MTTRKEDAWYVKWTKIVAAGTASLTAGGLLLSTLLFLQGYYDLPQKVANNTSILQGLIKQKPMVVDFLGSGIVSNPSITSGEDITIVYALRRNVSCATNIMVRFWDHNANAFLSRYSYTIPAQKAPVTEEFIPFDVRVAVPESLPSGTYSYAPIIIPSECGVYGPQLAPMSTPFEVVNVDEN